MTPQTGAVYTPLTISETRDLTCMPPDGPSDKDTLSEIISIVDPWPLDATSVAQGDGQ